MATVKVDGVWGPKTEAAFLETVGSWASSTAPITRDIDVALKACKAGAITALQTYLNICYPNWSTYYDGDVNGKKTMAKLTVDGVYGWRTKNALINYIAYCLKLGGTVFSTDYGFNIWQWGIGVDTVQMWINAANTGTPMPAPSPVNTGYTPYKAKR